MENSLIKMFYYAVIGWITSVVLYFTPIHKLIIALTIAFTLSLILGILAGIIVQNESLSMKKALSALFELMVYFVVTAALFSIGKTIGNAGWVIDILRGITWGLIYFYAANWFKNLKRLFPKSRGIAFLHFVFNLEFVKKFPMIKDYLDDEKKRDNTKA